MVTCHSRLTEAKPCLVSLFNSGTPSRAPSSPKVSLPESPSFPAWLPSKPSWCEASHCDSRCPKGRVAASVQGARPVCPSHSGSDPTQEGGGRHWDSGHPLLGQCCLLSEDFYRANSVHHPTFWWPDCLSALYFKMKPY